MLGNLDMEKQPAERWASEKRLILAWTGLSVAFSAVCLAIPLLYGEQFLAGRRPGLYWLEVYRRTMLHPLWITGAILTLVWLGLQIPKLMIKTPLGWTRRILLTLLLVVMWISALTGMGPSAALELGGEYFVHLDTLKTGEHIYHLAYEGSTQLGSLSCPPGQVLVGETVDEYRCVDIPPRVSDQYLLFECDAFDLVCSRVDSVEHRLESAVAGKLIFDAPTNRFRVDGTDVEFQYQFQP